MSVVIRCRWSDWADRDVPLPDYASAGAAGADLHANFREAAREVGVLLAPMQRAIVPTALHVAVPEGYEMQIRARSGLALRHGLALVNAPGTIDSDYRGEVGVLMINLGDAPVTISHGMRIAQAVIAPVVRASFEAVETLGDTDRGAGGFGSTGMD